jgi:hypothetical protein
MRFVNCTPHPITVQGLGTLPPCGVVPRVSALRSAPRTLGFVRLVRQHKGVVTGMPPAQAGVYYVVSGMVLDALAGARPDVVAPDTGPDAVRNEAGHIVSVLGFVE